VIVQVQQRFSGGEEVKSCRGGAEKGRCKCAGAAEVQFSGGAEVQRGANVQVQKSEMQAQRCSGVERCCRGAAEVQRCRGQWAGGRGADVQRFGCGAGAEVQR